VSQLADLHQKLTKAQGSVSSTRASAPAIKEKDGKVHFFWSMLRLGFLCLIAQQKEKEEKKKEDNQLAKSVKDRYSFYFHDLCSLPIYFFNSTKIAVEAQHGLIAQVIKDVIFSMRPQNGQAASTRQISDVADMAIG
jgi:COP9 signalosome complex subunit 5